MPDAIGRTVHEVLIAPLPLLLTQTAAAVAQAQVALDEAAMQTQEQLDALTRQAQAEQGEGDEPTGLARFQMDAPWYHFPQVEVELKLSLTVEVREQDRGGGKRVFHPMLAAMPHNARSQNLTSFQAEGTSRVHARIAAVPPPIREA
jgi:hypothetical protein